MVQFSSWTVIGRGIANRIINSQDFYSCLEEKSLSPWVTEGRLIKEWIQLFDDFSQNNLIVH